uniref:Uncharacterized protein n=1 Tax=Oncorhynchus mykiss TaxID=8022 RepID=A0A8C7ULC8_ONCMY
MFTIGSWTCIFLIICSMQSVCHCCDWSRHHYGHLSAECLSLLDQMGGDITEQEAPVFFPESLYRRIDDDQVRFRNETIYQITKLFDGNMKAVTWDKKKLDNFLNILERQFENLKSCVSNALCCSRQYDHDMTRKSTPLIFTCSFVFQNYSAQAWELIRKETKHHLQRLDIFKAKMH